jgi:hypothetical protein
VHFVRKTHEASRFAEDTGTSTTFDSVPVPLQGHDNRESHNEYSARSLSLYRVSCPGFYIKGHVLYGRDYGRREFAKLTNDTLSADKRRSLGRYSSLAGQSYGVIIICYYDNNLLLLVMALQPFCCLLTSFSVL